jgi:hypothetical protein
VLALWIGLYPKPMFDVLRVPSEKIVQAVGGKTATEPMLARERPGAPMGAPSSAGAALP